MAPKWDAQRELNLAILLLHQSSNSSINTDQIIQAWPGSDPPTTRAIQDRANKFKREAATMIENAAIAARGAASIAPATPPANRTIRKSALGPHSGLVTKRPPSGAKPKPKRQKQTTNESAEDADDDEDEGEDEAEEPLDATDHKNNRTTSPSDMDLDADQDSVNATTPVANRRSSSARSIRMTPRRTAKAQRSSTAGADDEPTAADDSDFDPPFNYAEHRAKEKKGRAEIDDGEVEV